MHFKQPAQDRGAACTIRPICVENSSPVPHHNQHSEVP